MMCDRRTVWRVVFSALVLISPGILPRFGEIHAQDAAVRDFRESVALDVDSVAVKKIRAAEDHLRAAQWSEAIEILRQVSEEHRNSLVSLSRGRFVNVQHYCDLLIVGMPGEGLRIYREKIDLLLKKNYETARDVRDEQQLERVIRQGFASSFGDDALLLLGDLAWEAGVLSKARSAWEKLLPLENPPPPGVPAGLLVYPDSDLSTALIRARLILCSFAEGEFDRGRMEMRVFARLHPEVTGEIAGQQGNLLQILEDVAAEPSQWKLPSPVGATRTFAMNRARAGRFPQPIDVGSPVWSIPLRKQVANPLNRREALPGVGSLSYFPVLYRDVVLVSDARNIYAYNQKTGKPWLAEDGENNSGSDARIYPLLPFEAGNPLFEPADSRRIVGTPRFTLTVADGRLFARMGALGTVPANQIARRQNSWIVCLDLEQEGKLIWELEASSLDAEGGKWSFEGSPLVAGSDLFVGIRRHDPQPQSNVVCLDAETGKLRWVKKICTGTVESAAEYSEISHQLLTYAEQTLYYSTNLGAIAAIEPEDGIIRWVVTYPRLDTDNPLTLVRRLDAGLLPCVFESGIVFAAPSDTDRVLAIHAETGVQLWERIMSAPVQSLLGVANGVLIGSSDHLWGLDTVTGGNRQHWKIGGPDPESSGYGRGVLAGDYIYYPTHDEILVVHQSGVLRHRIPLAALHQRTGGNLVITEGRMLMAEPERLSVFGTYSGVRKIEDLAQD